MISMGVAFRLLLYLISPIFPTLAPLQYVRGINMDNTGYLRHFIFCTSYSYPLKGHVVIKNIFLFQNQRCMTIWC